MRSEPAGKLWMEEYGSIGNWEDASASVIVLSGWHNPESAGKRVQ